MIKYAVWEMRKDVSQCACHQASGTVEMNLLRVFCLVICYYSILSCLGILMLEAKRSRIKRWFPFIYPYYYKRPFVPRVACIGSSNLEGVCLTQANCEKLGGTCSGNCPNKRGVCCVFQRTCGGIANSRVSYFHNPGHPNTYSGGSRCSVTINKVVPFICQLRLDFIDMSLAQPLNNGTCYNDFFLFGYSLLPSLCGENGGQHVYITFAPNCDTHILSVDTNLNIDFGRKWNVKVTQIPCNSTEIAPKGCLQYFTATSGSIMSFNFDPSVPAYVIDNLRWTRQLNGMNYGVCVRPGDNYCTIEWSQASSSPYTFTVSDDTVNLLGTPMSGDMCDHNFIVIPNPSQPDNSNLLTDRFCGNALLSTSSSSKPFVMTVVTRNVLDVDNANRGFHLNYRQVPCKI